MAKRLMNEAERFVLENWEEARRLEECMARIRTKYKELCQRVRRCGCQSPSQT